MIEVKHLTKRYGDFFAVNGVNFSVAPGEIVGFLGPNGAGKTTTFRILAGYFPPTSGEISMLGLRYASDSMAGRRRVGYLAENNPLWTGMEVTEYLSFIWDARSLGGTEKKEERIREVVASCGLKDAVGSDIGELSKGYRQRVGLAAAILHDPEILLLDEPTSGLDPIQAREVRELIKSFKEKKTILISTHILSEVQAICDRVLILHKGELVANQKTSQLTHDTKEYVIMLHVSRRLIRDIEDIAGIPGVTTVDGPHTVTNGEVSYRIRAASDIRSEIFKYASLRMLPLLELKMERSSLEDVFHALTKK